MAKTKRKQHNATAPPIVFDGARVTWKFLNTAQVYEVSMDYVTTDHGVIGFAELLALAAAVDTATTGLISAITDPTTSETEVAVFCTTNNAIPTAQRTIVSAGIIGTAPIPQEMCGLMVKRTGLRGMHGRGHMYWPGVPTTFVTPATDPNRLNPVGILAYGVLATRLQGAMTDLSGRSWTPVVATRPVPPAFLVTNAAPIVSVNVVSLLATQRRRKEGRGI